MLSPIAARNEPPRWRNELLAWARTTTAAEPLTAPTLEGSVLHALVRRLELSPAAAHVLAALYAAWLDGRAEAGTSMARLAELAAIAGDDAWSEALGTGHLDELGLVRRSLGRVRLAVATGDFLDGRGPAVAELIGDGAPAALPDGVFRVEADRGESARACAQRLTRAHGLDLVSTVGTIALCDPEGSPRGVRPILEQGRLEAWLRGIAMATTHDVGDLVPRPAETVLWIVPPGAPERPGAPPRWRP